MRDAPTIAKNLYRLFQTRQAHGFRVQGKTQQPEQNQASFDGHFGFLFS